jgi:Uma2 family endonuclease
MESGPVTDVTPQSGSDPTRITIEEYLRLVEDGVLTEDDRVELLEGVIVAMTPSDPPHAAIVQIVAAAIRAALRRGVVERVQASLIVGGRSVPEPDVAVVPGAHLDYLHRHPDRALLVVEVSQSSLAQDRLSKSRIYAVGGVPEYWIVNLRQGMLEVMRDPDPTTAVYRSIARLTRSDRIQPVAYTSAEIAVSDLLPPEGAG